MSGITWNTIQQGLVDWVKSSMSLDDDHVDFSGQNAPRPSGTWASLKLVELRPLGRPTNHVENNPAPTVGNEILIKSRNQHRVGIEVTVYASLEGKGANLLASTPLALLTTFKEAAYVDTRAFALRDAGIGISSFSPILTIDGVKDSTLIDPRAKVTVYFFVASEIIESATFIEFVELENLSTGTSTYVPLDPIP